MESRATRHWIWLGLMLAAAVWYAWPQAVYSLFPLYDLVRFLFPHLAAGLHPWIEAVRGAAGG